MTLEDAPVSYQILVQQFEAHLYSKAIQTGQELLQTGVDSVKIHEIIAASYGGLGQYDHAITAYEQCFTYELSDIHKQQILSNFSKAIDLASKPYITDKFAIAPLSAYADKILAIDPNNIMGLHLRAVYLRRQGNLEQAAQLCRQGIALHQQNDQLWVTLGMIKLQQGDSQQAVRCFETARAVNRHNQ
ncbi:MAG: tetratricopeptide repeat protein, partial [Alphaproteobacteria bacterium]